VNENAGYDHPRHPIRVVTRRTGLTAATLRAWERRHGAVKPARTGTERRLYSDADIERLRLMRELSGAGHSVAQLARRETEELRVLAREEIRNDRERESADAVRAGAGSLPQLATTVDAEAARDLLAQCDRAVQDLDGATLHRLLMRALVQWGPLSFVSEIAAPLCRRIGTLWENGTLCVAHEHVASVAIRQALGFLLDTVRGGASTRPTLLVTTPSGQRHEFGAMMAGAMAALAGWNVVYLGPDLPAADVLVAARQTRARALALSIVAAADEERIAGELRALRAGVGSRLPLLVGGAAAGRHAPLLEEIGARRVTDFTELTGILDELVRARRPDA
jgi:methanogenic corrinoid protein MtbC1